MKTLLKSMAALAVLTFFFSPGLVRAQDDTAPQGGDDQDASDASFQNFYDDLGDQGSWIQTDDYGYVFQPNVTDPDWQPYSDGYWADSDAGLVWVSDEPWGWATYHYGRWANIDGIGWVWVPGYRWAPAWVSWRYGGGYCGWAPLPPETFYGAEYGEPGGGVFDFHFGGDVDVAFNIGPGCYNFVRVEDMGEHNYHGHIVNRSNNFAIINHTTNVTNLNVTNHGSSGNRFDGITVGGPPINELNAHARQPIQTVQLTASNQPGRSTLQGNTLAVYAPKVDPGTLHNARPSRVEQSINHPTFNRGDSISKPLAVTRTLQPPAPSPEAIHAAEMAQAQAPATAKIATPKTEMRMKPTQSLTSLAPVAPVHPSTSATTFHPENQNNNGGQMENPHSSFTPEPNTFHPENQGNGGEVHSTYMPPPSTFHPENQNNGGGGSGGNPHPANAPAPPTVHPSNTGGNGGGNHPPSGNGQKDDGKKDDKKP